jgi:hypothetical protein
MGHQQECREQQQNRLNDPRLIGDIALHLHLMAKLVIKIQETANKALLLFYMLQNETKFDKNDSIFIQQHLPKSQIPSLIKS